MALQKTETFKGSAEFTGYWALGPLVIDPFNRQARVQLGLFWSAEAYQSDPTAVLKLSDTFVIEGSNYDAIFPTGANTEDMPTLAEIMLNIFVFIKSSLDFEGNPGYFADADFVA